MHMSAGLWKPCLFLNAWEIISNKLPFHTENIKMYSKTTGNTTTNKTYSFPKSCICLHKYDK